jgi:hypothetical protein
VRLRFGHTRLTNSRLLRGDPEPSCVHYGLPLTFPHMLLQYQHCDQECRAFHLQGTLGDIIGDGRGQVFNVVVREKVKNYPHFCFSNLFTQK